MRSLKFKLFLFALLFVSACNKQSFSEDFSVSINCNYISSTSIDIDTALGYLDSFFDSVVYPQTKGGKPFSYDIESVNIVRGSAFVGTKSQVSTLPDSLFYVVPFDEGGYAILSADSRYPSSVVCVCEDGHCDEADFVNAYEMLNSDSSLSNSSNDDDLFNFELILAGFINCANVKVATKSNGVDPGPGEIGGGGPSGITKYGPLTYSKWSQTTAGSNMVFNQYTPNNAKAGCTVIAVAQIMMANNFPETITFGDTTCRMTSMLMVAPYSNPVYPGPDSSRIQAGAFAKGLGSYDNVRVTYGSNQNEATGVS